MFNTNFKINIQQTPLFPSPIEYKPYSFIKTLLILNNDKK